MDSCLTVYRQVKVNLVEWYSSVYIYTCMITLSKTLLKILFARVVGWLTATFLYVISYLSHIFLLLQSKLISVEK